MIKYSAFHLKAIGNYSKSKNNVEPLGETINKLDYCHLLLRDGLKRFRNWAKAFFCVCREEHTTHLVIPKAFGYLKSLVCDEIIDDTRKRTSVKGFFT